MSRDPTIDARLEEALEAAWAAELRLVTPENGWVEESLPRLFRAAAEVEALRRLFPFTSLNRLCFSRCSRFPFTFDCPCVAADRGFYTVLATWSVAGEPPVLGETTSVAEALALVVKNLPADRRAWVGTSDGAPR